MKSKVRFKPIIIGLVSIIIPTLVLYGNYLFPTAPAKPKPEVKLHSEWVTDEKSSQKFLVANFGKRRLVIPEGYVARRAPNHNHIRISTLWPYFISLHGNVKQFDRPYNYRERVVLGITYYPEKTIDDSKKVMNLKYSDNFPPGELEKKEKSALGHEYVFSYNQQIYHMRCSFDVSELFSSTSSDKCRLRIPVNRQLIVLVDINREPVLRWRDFAPQLFQFIDHIFIESDESDFKFSQFPYTQGVVK